MKPTKEQIKPDKDYYLSFDSAAGRLSTVMPGRFLLNELKNNPSLLDDLSVVRECEDEQDEN
jgi:hypothetical protein